MTVNPFNAMAVTQIPDTTSPGVETDPIRAAKAYLDDYIAAPSTGNVIAVVGDYGTGKTHLAGELLKHAHGRCEQIYVEATPNAIAEPRNRFTGLYRRFVEAQADEKVFARLTEVYAGIVADHLHSTGASPQTVQWLRDGALDPQVVVEKMQLQSSSLLGRLKTRLLEITRHQAFSTALTLLLREELKDFVWGWLRGGAPQQVLVDRGIEVPLTTDDAALAVMGAFVRLHAHGDRRFLLVIDELHKTVAGGPDDVGMSAFQTLLQQFDSAGAFLVLTGLPELTTVLRRDVRQRITHEIGMSRFGAGHVRQYIETAQGGAGLEPFSTDVVDYLVSLANGTPRTVIRLCHHLYRRWAADGTPITHDLVREVARDVGLSSFDDVEAATTRLLDAENFSHLRHHFLGQGVDTRVDFWVTFAEGTAGCAIVLTDSVLDTRDAERLTAQVLALRKIVLNCRVLLVVNGVLAAEPEDRLAGVLSRPPLVYERLSYADHMTALLRAIENEVRAGSGHDPMTLLQQAMEQLTRQQAGIHGFIERVAAQLDEVRSISDGRLDALQAQLDDIAGDLRTLRDGGLAGGGERPVRLPPLVEKEFTRALDRLTEVLDVDAALAGDFAEGATGQRLPMFLRQGLESTAVAIVLRPVVLEFRGAVSAWYTAEVLAASGPVPQRAYDRLDELCHTFDRITEQVPIARLEELAAGRKLDLVRTFYNLSVNVRHGFR
ncbi:AAA family ATPase [Lentzea jiangxiensis]|uniref:AAA+ ATPase domain-containing protein n=1 Tax=Lentzea jiangxiensis TaxID=641025 RepID=A0A1H0X029_9PSEU|nr:AAA family ATPase [Lentzea jiangxiensis]SDP96301.1 hypothetical protein SAMN05421507_12734 [Lentzea jiangxiensis]